MPLRERKYNVITPLKKIDKNIKGYPISTMDVETILINKVQIPIAISFAYFYKNKNIKTIFKLANKILLLNKPEKAVSDLWIRFYGELNKLYLGATR